MNQPSDALGQETELALLASLLPLAEPTFVDIGAERGSFSRWALGHGLSGVAIEPLPGNAGALRELARDGRLKLLDCAVDAQDGERELHIATDEAGQPLNHFHSLQKLTNDARVRHTQALKVSCRSLASLRAAGLVPPRTGILKIDTEGNDLRVLQGMAPFEADLLIVEYFTQGLYAGWTEADPTRLILQAEALGYEHCLAIRRTVTGLEQVTYQPLAFQPGEWGNLIFLKQASFCELRTRLAAHAAVLGRDALAKVAELQKICDDRLQVINDLSGARLPAHQKQ